MAFLLCRNRVTDFARWKTIFDSHNVFFLFNVTDMSKARAFISNAPAEEAAKESGVVDGDYHFIDNPETRGTLIHGV